MFIARISSIALDGIRHRRRSTALACHLNKMKFSLSNSQSLCPIDSIDWVQVTGGLGNTTWATAA